MNSLLARELNTVRNTQLPGQSLVPLDNITTIRISFYSLRLAKSDVFTPRLWEYKWVVDQHINSCGEIASVCVHADRAVIVRPYGGRG